MTHWRFAHQGLMILCAGALASCGRSSNTCEQANEHLSSCLGSDAPQWETCEPSTAERILSMDCHRLALMAVDELRDLHRDVTGARQMVADLPPVQPVTAELAPAVTDPGAKEQIIADGADDPNALAVVDGTNQTKTSPSYALEKDGLRPVSFRVSQGKVSLGTITQAVPGESSTLRFLDNKKKLVASLLEKRVGFTGRRIEVHDADGKLLGVVEDFGLQRFIWNRDQRFAIYDGEGQNIANVSGTFEREGGITLQKDEASGQGVVAQITPAGQWNMQISVKRPNEVDDRVLLIFAAFLKMFP